MDPRLKEPCQRPANRSAPTYGALLDVATDLELWGECNERKVIDLGKSTDGPAEPPKKKGWFD